MRLIVSGGGTAGHISPILATLDVLKSLDNDLEVLYVGQKGSMEAKIARGAGLEFAEISAGKFRRYHNISLLHKITDLSSLWLNVKDIFKVLAGIKQSINIIREFDPDIVFIKGGYVGLPVGLAAGLLKVPFVVHESDMRPGMTNKFLSKQASVVAVGFPVDTYSNLPKEKLVYTGNPIRKTLVSAHRLEGITRFKLEHDLQVILVTGGSQGAAAINHAVVEALPELTQQYQILHIVGERNIEQVKFDTKRLKLDHPERYQPFSFLTDTMGQALAAADLVVGRGGANTFAELAILGKPSVIIPHPGLEDQMINAQTLARRGAIRVIQQERLSGAFLAAEINKILSSEKEQKLLSEGIKRFAVHDAGERLANLLIQEAHERVRDREEALEER